jgi:hypothetical protein
MEFCRVSRVKCTVLVVIGAQAEGFAQERRRHSSKNRAHSRLRHARTEHNDQSVARWSIRSRHRYLQAQNQVFRRQ